MADLSREDIDLLSRELPTLSAINVSSPLYAGGEGRVAYRAAGGNERPALLLLHGLGSSSAGYRAQLAGLSREFHVIAWNAPGFEDSTPISITEPRMDDYADVATAFFDAPTANSTHLLGSRRVAVAPSARRFEKAKTTEGPA